MARWQPADMPRVGPSRRQIGEQVDDWNPRRELAQHRLNLAGMGCAKAKISE